MKKAVMVFLLLVVVVVLFFLVRGALLAAPLGYVAAQAMSAEVSVGKAIVALAVISTLIYAVVESLIAPWIFNDKAGFDERPDYVQERRETLIKIIVALFGVVVTVTFGIDLLAIALAQAGFVASGYPIAAGIVGQVLTGLLIAQGAKWFHDVVGGLGLS